MFFYQLQNELWKLFAKKRSYIGFLMFLLAQNTIIFVYRFTHVAHGLVRMMENNGLIAQKFLSMLTISTLMVCMLAYTLMPLYVALIGGDLIAKEAEDGTLRMILCRPISRIRLVFLKWLAGGIFSFVLILSLGVFGLLFTSFWFPKGGLLVIPPFTPFGVFEWTEGLHRYCIAHSFMVFHAATVMTLGLMFSCFNMKPAAATILALSFMIISRIMQDLPFFSDYQEWFITYHAAIWREVFSENIPWWKIGQSLSVLAGYNITFLVVGCTALQMRDIKS